MVRRPKSSVLLLDLDKLIEMKAIKKMRSNAEDLRDCVYFA
ncbi:hypothetical protein FACS189485_22520 [Spirochaetia bacterium]|nr:hypothetical protein FACS189485_22520 [Spirochaetia bacterium]